MRASTKPASRSTRRCLDTDVCGIRSFFSISPTDRSDDESRPRIARRLGSAMIANEDSTGRIYALGHMPVKADAIGVRWARASPPSFLQFCPLGGLLDQRH